MTPVLRPDKPTCSWNPVTFQRQPASLPKSNTEPRICFKHFRHLWRAGEFSSFQYSQLLQCQSTGLTCQSVPAALLPELGNGAWIPQLPAGSWTGSRKGVGETLRSWEFSVWSCKNGRRWSLGIWWAQVQFTKSMFKRTVWTQPTTHPPNALGWFESDAYTEKNQNRINVY